jgi:DNA-binding beta-propeller fold protein YncE
MRTPSARRVGLALFCAAFSVCARAQLLLVANQGNATVSLIDVTQGKEVASIAEHIPDGHGHEIVATPDGRIAFLPIYGNSGVGRPGTDGRLMQVIDVPSRKIIATVDFGHGVRPHQPVLDPTHQLLYVTTELDDAISIVDPRTYKIVGKVPTGQPESHMLVLTHDGTRGYTANVGPGTVSVLDLTGRKTLAVIHVSGNVQRISIANDDKRVFTSDQTAPRLAVIDTATNKVAEWVELPGTGYGTAPTHDGRFLLVCIPSTNEVAVVDLAAMKVVRRLKVPATPQEVLIRPDGKVAYVSCNSRGKVAALNLSNWSTQILAAGPGADGLAWAK